MSMALDYAKYMSPEGVEAWFSRCKFKTRKQGADALEIPVRTLYRYLAGGLPEGAPGNFVAYRMHRIEMSRKRRD